MPLPSFATDFALGFSLILAIGAQNAFVLRQGLLRRHVFVVVLFCALADMLLIVAGVAGVSLLIADFAERHAPLLFGIAALWLAAYGGLRLRSAVRAGSALACLSKNSRCCTRRLGSWLSPIAKWAISTI